MHAAFEDITSRIPTPPLWWDACGCPRYDPFHPQLCSAIYAREIALLRIRCQSCHKQFDVEVHGSAFAPLGNPAEAHYGDPPRHKDDNGQGCFGETMNCEDLDVLQAWTRELPPTFDWVRHPDWEGPIR